MSQKKHIFCALDFSDLKKTIEFTNIIKDHVSQIHFNEKDVVRHHLVQKIVYAYENSEK